MFTAPDLLSCPPAMSRLPQLQVGTQPAHGPESEVGLNFFGSPSVAQDDYWGSASRWVEVWRIPVPPGRGHLGGDWLSPP